MRTAYLIFIPAIIISRVTADTGKSYAKEKVCEELRTIGAKDFRVILTAAYSQKFPNGTFEEVSCVADEMMKLAEKCCQDDANPDCYDKGATEISEKSCGKNSPFPKHPDIEQCCSVQGHERKLCLATLRYSTDKLPSLLEPTPEEICTQYTQDPDAFALRYVYEFAPETPEYPCRVCLQHNPKSCEDGKELLQPDCL